MTNKIALHHSARLVLLAVASLALPAVAVTPQKFSHTTADDFSAGKATSVAVTSKGQVKLSRKITPVVAATAEQLGAAASSVYAAVPLAEGSVVVAVDDRVVKVAPDGKVTTLATFADQIVFALHMRADGQLLVGTGGNEAGVYVVATGNPGKAEPLVKTTQAQNYWAFTTVAGRVFVATGPDGKVIEVPTTPLAAGAEPTVLADLAEPNVLALSADASGNLLAGTDVDGLIYRISPANPKPFVIYDAAESEVVWLGTDAAGNIIAVATEPDESGSPDSSGPSFDFTLPEGGMMLEGQSTSRATDDTAPSDSEDGKKDEPKKDAEKKSDDTKPDLDKPSHIGGGIEGEGEGSAVYRIDTESFVTQLHRTDMPLYTALLTPTSILLGGGGDDGGKIIELSPDGLEHATLATTDSADVTALIAAENNQVLLGLSNSAGMSRLESALAPSGTLVSDVLDADQIAQFGRLSVSAVTPAGTSVTIATRTSNVEDTEAVGWSDWSAEAPAGESLAVTSPRARFLQYRLTLATTSATTPGVSEVHVTYQLPNRAPRLDELLISNAESDDEDAPVSARMRSVTWSGTDENDDTLSYSLHVQSIADGPAVSDGPWLLLKEKLSDASFDWDTSRLPDGNYRLRVTASDSPSNTTDTAKTADLVSKKLVVDNTPPQISDIKVVRSADKITITANVNDSATSISKIEAAVNSLEDWHVGQAADTIFDSSQEAVRVVVSSVSGAAVITLRATDENGNQSLAHVRIPAEK